MRWDISDQRDIDEMSAEPIDANDPAERIEHAEPTDPIDRNEPTEPIESIEPFEPIERNESSDHTATTSSSQTSLACPASVTGQVRSARTAMAALRPLSAMTLPAGWVAAPQR